jgi:hypothetical protein
VTRLEDLVELIRWMRNMYKVPVIVTQRKNLLGDLNKDG